MFYIESIWATGPNVIKSEIEFCKGLNIIHGPSNTGKSYIVDCLDFMLGATSIRMGDQTGYDCIHMRIDVTLQNDQQENFGIELSRHIGSKEFFVDSQNEDFVQSGQYKIGNGTPHISDVWLRLMGMDEPVYVWKNSRFDTQRMTTRTFIDTFFLTEERVITQGSILIPEQVISQTATKNSILYFINGIKQGDKENKIETKEMLEKKRDAVVDYLHSHLEKIEERKKALPVHTEKSFDLRNNMDQILREIENAEAEVTKAVSKSRELAQEIIAINKDIAQNHVVENRYNVLLSQYEADIKRLTFLVEGEIHKDDSEVPSRCPFCNGELQKEEEESCVEAASTEIKKLIPQISDLREAMDDLKYETDEYNRQLVAKENERAKVEGEIQEVLQPKLEQLRENLRQYPTAIRSEAENDIVEDIQKEIQDDLYAKMGEVYVDQKHSVNEEFDEDFNKKFSRIIVDILKECAFDDGADEAVFNPKTFDVNIGKQLKRSYGKGYAAFLNVAVAMSLHVYFDKFGAYRPGMFIVDSPILSLSEKMEGDKPVSDGMKASLFEYFVAHRNDRQSIIVENVIPGVNYDYDNVKVIEFTKTDQGRYGFLKSRPQK